MRNPIIDSEKAFRAAYSVYEWMRDNPIIEESKTSMLLHRPDFSHFGNRLGEEMNELLALSRGEHKHSDSPKDDFLMESHEVWYWLALADVNNHLPYDIIVPHKHAMAGYEDGAADDFIIDANGTRNVIKTTERCMEFLGGMCKHFGAEPAEIAVYDLKQMKQRFYLHEALRKAGYMK